MMVPQLTSTCRRLSGVDRTSASALASAKAHIPASAVIAMFNFLTRACPKSPNGARYTSPGPAVYRAEERGSGSWQRPGAEHEIDSALKGRDKRQCINNLPISRPFRAMCFYLVTQGVALVVLHIFVGSQLGVRWQRRGTSRRHRFSPALGINPSTMQKRCRRPTLASSLRTLPPHSKSTTSIFGPPRTQNGLSSLSKKMCRTTRALPWASIFGPFRARTLFRQARTRAEAPVLSFHPPGSCALRQAHRFRCRALRCQW